MKTSLLKTIDINYYGKTFLQYIKRFFFYCCKLREWLALYFLYKDIRPEYAKFIKHYYSNKNKLETKITEKRVIYRNDWDKTCGLADRLKGILSAYHLAKKSGRNFYIYWTKPFPLTKYLEPTSFDWRINSDEISYTKDSSLPIIIVARNPYYFQNTIESKILKHYFRTNKELHVRTNHFLCENNVAELFNDLFKPTEILQKELDKYTAGRLYYSFSFRFIQLLGDFEDEKGEILGDDDKKKLINKCLKALGSLVEQLPAGYRAFVASDSETFLKQARELDSRIFCVEGEIQHPISYFRGNNKNSDVHLKTFLDFFLIMRAEKVYRLQTGKMYASGFPQLAALAGNKQFIKYNF